MKLINALTLAFFSLVNAYFSDPIFTEDPGSVIPTEYMIKLGNAAPETNPIVLDATKYGLKPSRMFTTLQSPGLHGTPPPGIVEFMFSQIALSGERPDGYKYPLFLGEANKLFNASKPLVSFASSCDKTTPTCKNCYQPISVNKPNCKDITAAATNALQISPTDKPLQMTVTQDLSSGQVVTETVMPENKGQATN
ncbi:hypothetical protein GINT2_002052 [Glugoides intestinalis]